MRRLLATTGESGLLVLRSPMAVDPLRGKSAEQWSVGRGLEVAVRAVQQDKKMAIKYHLTIYPTFKNGKWKYGNVPRVGDLLRVESIREDVRDFHWGECIVIDLVPEQVPVEEIIDALKAD